MNGFTIKFLRLLLVIPVSCLFIFCFLLIFEEVTINFENMNYKHIVPILVLTLSPFSINYNIISYKSIQYKNEDDLLDSPSAEVKLKKTSKLILIGNLSFGIIIVVASYLYFDINTIEINIVLFLIGLITIIEMLYLLLRNTNEKL